MAATVLAGASPFHPAVLSVPEGDLVLLADDPAPVGLHPDERLAAVAAAVDWVPARLFRDDLFLGDWLPDGMKSADGRWRQRQTRQEKNLVQRKQKDPT